MLMLVIKQKQGGGHSAWSPCLPQALLLFLLKLTVCEWVVTKWPWGVTTEALTRRFAICWWKYSFPFFFRENFEWIISYVSITISFCLKMYSISDLVSVPDWTKVWISFTVPRRLEQAYGVAGRVRKVSGFWTGNCQWPRQNQNAAGTA